MADMNLHLKRKPRTDEGEKVGFYGCMGKVVRLESVDKSYPRHLRLECPSCGHEHTVKPTWRKYIAKIDEDKEATPV